MARAMGNKGREEELAFRFARPIFEIVVYSSGDTYPLCTQCRVPMEREYQCFCDRCGQRLD